MNKLVIHRDKFYQFTRNTCKCQINLRFSGPQSTPSVPLHPGQELLCQRKSLLSYPFYVDGTILNENILKRFDLENNSDKWLFLSQSLFVEVYGLSKIQRDCQQLECSSDISNTQCVLKNGACQSLLQGKYMFVIA